MVRRSASPKEEAAFSSAALRVSIFCFCVSISRESTWFREDRASSDLSCFENWEVTRFISEPSTLNCWFISESAFLNSRSPSMPSFIPMSDVVGHLLKTDSLIIICLPIFCFSATIYAEASNEYGSRVLPTGLCSTILLLLII